MISRKPSTLSDPRLSEPQDCRTSQRSRNFRMLDPNSLFAVFPDQLAQRAVEGRERLCDLYMDGRAEWEVWRS